MRTTVETSVNIETNQGDEIAKLVKLAEDLNARINVSSSYSTNANYEATISLHGGSVIDVITQLLKVASVTLGVTESAVLKGITEDLTEAPATWDE